MGFGSATNVEPNWEACCEHSRASVARTDWEPWAWGRMQGEGREEITQAQITQKEHIREATWYTLNH